LSTYFEYQNCWSNSILQIKHIFVIMRNIEQKKVNWNNCEIWYNHTKCRLGLEFNATQFW
jgi:hypothetical protein